MVLRAENRIVGQRDLLRFGFGIVDKRIEKLFLIEKPH